MPLHTINMPSDGPSTNYFAYGSNLLKERISINNPTAVFQTVAKLKDYKLVFYDIGFDDWKGGAASIETDGDSEVWGVVWTVNFQDLLHLDRQEKGYRRHSVEVETTEGRTLQCVTYQFADDLVSKVPSPHYMDVIIRGARQHSLPRHYVQTLESLPHNNYEGPVPLYDDIMKRIQAKGSDDMPPGLQL